MDIETIKNQSEMKPYTKMKVNLQGINCRVGEAENQISDLEYKEAKNTQSEQQEGNRIQKNEDSLRKLWDNFRYTNFCIMDVSEGRESKKLEAYLRK